MIYSPRRIIRDLVAPNRRLSCSSRVWRDGLKELHRRTESTHESGAFLLGRELSGRREIVRFVYYDDLDPHCLDNGIVVFDGAGYGPLWETCRREGLMVVADIHVHPQRPDQSELDRHNPMISTRGHIALIVPNYAIGVQGAKDLGIYEFTSDYTWLSPSDEFKKAYFYIGVWG